MVFIRPLFSLFDTKCHLPILVVFFRTTLKFDHYSHLYLLFYNTFWNDSFRPPLYLIKVHGSLIVNQWKHILLVEQQKSSYRYQELVRILHDELVQQRLDRITNGTVIEAVTMTSLLKNVFFWAAAVVWSVSPQLYKQVVHTTALCLIAAWGRPNWTKYSRHTGTYILYLYRSFTSYGHCSSCKTKPKYLWRDAPSLFLTLPWLSYG